MMFNLTQNEADIKAFGDLVLNDVKDIASQWISEGRTELLPSYKEIKFHYDNFVSNPAVEVDDQVTARLMYFRTFMIFFSTIVTTLLDGPEAAEEICEAYQDKALYKRLAQHKRTTKAQSFRKVSGTVRPATNHLY